MQERQDKSIGWVIVALGITVAYFGWVFLAADYHPVAQPGGQFLPRADNEMGRVGTYETFILDNRYRQM